MTQRFTIPKPCPKKWTELAGEGRSRFCSECNLHVHSLADYSQDEIDSLRRVSSVHLCGYLPVQNSGEPRSRRAVLVGALLTAISPLMAQSGIARIRVTDPTGALIPFAAEASVLDGQGKPTVTAHANAEGEIVFSGLPLGDSKIQVTCLGFSSQLLVITIGASGQATAEARLQLGTVGEVVEVILGDGRAPADPMRAVPDDNLVLAPVPPAPEPPAKKKRKRRWIF